MRLVRTAPALLSTLLLAGCAGDPLPPPVVAHPVDAPIAPPPPPAPPLAPARWIEGGGATLIGPSIGDATLVLLGGRRALVAKDGAVTAERATTPEPLIELIQVPSAAGARLVGRGRVGLYRFDDPLGPARALGHTEGEITRLGAAPGVVAYWTRSSDLPRFLDVESGAPTTLAGLPEAPLRAIAYVDAKQGAAVFEAAGLAVTTDGGASWKVASDTGQLDALRIAGLRRRGDVLRAFPYAEGPDGAVDVTAARLGPFEQPRAIGDEPALFRWIRATGRDPLEAVASGGLDLQASGALVGSHGHAARIDPKTGAILELLDFAHGKEVSPCSLARSGDAAWIACYLADEQGGKNLFDPFGVARIALGRAPLAVERPVLIRNGEVELRSSPSGGALLLGPCSGEGDGQACVRQPDGKWLNFQSDVQLDTRGTGALADGRIALVRGLFDGDEGPEAEAQAAANGVNGAEDEAARAHPTIHLALRDALGKEVELPPITISGSRDDLRIQSPIEEQPDRSLHLVIETAEGVFAVTQSASREGASVQSIPGALAARIHAGRGIAVGEAHALASLDAGQTWAEIPAPAHVLGQARWHGSSIDDPRFLMVSEVGAKLGDHLRLGWGPDAGPIEERGEAAGPLLASTPKIPDRTPVRMLSCKSEGPATSAPPLLASNQIKALLGSKPAPRGTRRETSTWVGHRAGMLDTVALLEEDGPDKKGSAPATWTLHWHDATEIGGKPHAWAGPIPGEGGFGTGVRFAAASGARALFALRRGAPSGKHALVRVRSNGKADVVDLGDELLPTGEVVFGADRSDTIAWLHETTLIVWNVGEAPRAVAQIATHGIRTLGQPMKEGVPVMIGSSDWAMMRVIPVPALDAKAGKRPPPPAAPSLDGWTRLAFLARDTAALPVCAASAKGPRFVLHRGTMGASVDGFDESAMIALYEVRVTGGDACVAGISALVTPDRRAKASAPSATKGAPKGKGTALVPGAPVAFVRADLAGKRAEGGERGVAPGSVRRLSCALVPRP